MSAEEPRFLVVEDEFGTRTQLVRFFSRFGRVNAIATSEEARALLSSNSYWGVIIDWRLPGEDGLALLGHLRVHYPDTPALLITGYLDRDCINEVHALGAEYISKPARPDNLRAFAVRAIARRGEPEQRILATARKYSEAHGLPAAESTILLLALQDVARKDLPARLGLSENTVKTTVRRLLCRCNASDLDTLVKSILRDMLRDGFSKVGASPNPRYENNPPPRR